MYIVLTILAALMACASVAAVFMKGRRKHLFWLIPGVLIMPMLAGASMTPEQRASMEASRASREAMHAANAAARAEETEKARREAQAKAETEAAERRTRQAAADAACRQDLQCWAQKHVADAGRACEPLIQASARTDYRWTTSFTRFSRFGWGDQGAGIVNYAGDEIEMQNGFGNWVRHTYHCAYDTQTGRATNFTVRAGRT
ncbi:hypothetical protein J8J14_23885 [Roseomonas sp. SSH11]|uniref:Uncharacterized protein n=1 Tax=Pararoseomonas baculiformis TaxID=2820812 RepID=A0ABS4AMK5_9PROT|nr:hypothetical protein [Pararoseomonas baculiformis]